MTENEIINSTNDNENPSVALELKENSYSKTDTTSQKIDIPKEKQEPYWQKFLRRWLIVIMTGAMAWYTAKLFKLTKTQAQENSIMAQNAFELSQRIAATQEKYAKIDTRAYIAFQGFVDFRLPTREGAEININLYNSGRTPANNLRAHIATKKYIGKGVWKTDMDSLKKIALKNSAPYWTVGPMANASIEFPLNMVATKEDSIKIYRRETNLYVFGFIDYVDIFNDADTTFFCLQFIPPNKFIGNSIYNYAK